MAATTAELELTAVAAAAAAEPPGGGGNDRPPPGSNTMLGISFVLARSSLSEPTTKRGPDDDDTVMITVFLVFSQLYKLAQLHLRATPHGFSGHFKVMWKVSLAVSLEFFFGCTTLRHYCSLFMFLN